MNQCPNCGFSLEETESRSKKLKLKIIIPVAVAILVGVIAIILIPVLIAGRYNGKYYRLRADGTPDNKDYYVLKFEKWTDEDGLSGYLQRKGENVILYYTFFGETTEIAVGTVKNHALNLNDEIYISEKHKHKFGEWEIAQEPTCIEVGIAARTCSCGLRETQTIEASGHNFGEWSETKKATCTEEGISERVCTKCKESETQTIAIKPHEYEYWDYDAVSHWKPCANCDDKTEEGRHTGENECKVCGYVYGDTVGLSYIRSAKDCSVVGIGSATDKDIKIPEIYRGLMVTRISSFAFKDCKSLTSIAIPSGVSIIASNAFQGCDTSLIVTFKDNTTYIADSLFNNCESLINVAIPDKVTYIGKYAFAGCHSLKSVHITDIPAWCRITFEDENANPLYYAKNLYLNNQLITKLDIPDGVKTIKNYAFYGCSYLNTVTIPDSVTSIGNGVFANCGNIKITVSSGNTNYRIVDNCLIDMTSKTLLWGNQDSIIPTDGSVTYIGDFAFSYCTSLKSIIIPDSVTSIGNHAFQQCRFEDIIIPDSVKHIGNEAFYACYFLKSITIGNGVTYIDRFAFGACSILKGINFNGTKAQWNAITKRDYWNSSTGDYTVNCTDGNLDKYGNEV